MAPPFRRRRPESCAVCTGLLQPEEGSDLPRPRRGRPPLRGGGAGGETIRRSATRIRRSRGSRTKSDGVRGRKLLNIGDCECFDLSDAQSSPEKLQSLPPPGPNFSSPELPDPEQPVHAEGGGHPFVASPQAVHGEGQEFTTSLLSEHGEGQFSAVREVPLLTLEPAEVSYRPSAAHSEHNELKSSQGEALPSMVLEQTEPSEEQTSPVERPSVLSLEKPEKDGHGPEMPENDVHGSEISENGGHYYEISENEGHGPEKPENSGHDSENEKLENDDHDLEKPDEDHDNCSSGKRTAMVALEQEELVPGSDEVGSSGASTKKRKSHGKRRRLRLWFEG